MFYVSKLTAQELSMHMFDAETMNTWSRDIGESWGRRERLVAYREFPQKVFKDIHCSSCVNLVEQQFWSSELYFVRIPTVLSLRAFSSNIRTSGGVTALHAAAANGHDSVT